MITLARSDKSILGRWWWTIDRWTLMALIMLMGFGILLIQAATPAIAVRQGHDTFFFRRALSGDAGAGRRDDVRHFPAAAAQYSLAGGWIACGVSAAASRHTLCRPRSQRRRPLDPYYPAAA